MGTGCLSYPPMPPIFTLVIIIVATTFVKSVVHGCDLNSCYDKYQIAKATLHAGMMDETDSPICVAFRTYYNCVIRNSKGCKGNIRYHSTKNSVKHQLKINNCSIVGQEYNSRNKSTRIDNVEFMCNFRGEKIHKVCGLFGDPHLRTFNAEFQTCKIEGAWPLVNNRHLTVQVSNDPVVDNGAATATSKLTIVIKKNIDCAADRFVMYQAQSDNLPPSFYDGHTHYGPDKSVELIEETPGKRIKIYLRYIDTEISVQRVGQYFTFAIKMPEEVVNSTEDKDSLELCVTGCPKSEQINYQEYLAKAKNKVLEISTLGDENIVMSRSEAVELCRKAELKDFYFDSCVFDLITTGDKNFTMAAYKAWQEILELLPNGTQGGGRDSLDKIDERYLNHAASRTSCICSCRILLLTLFCIWLSNRLTLCNS